MSTSDINLNGKVINWCSEIKYLGVYISAATTFKCNFYNAKMKFFISLNSLLSKLGSSPDIGITLYMHFIRQFNDSKTKINQK